MPKLLPFPAVDDLGLTAMRQHPDRTPQGLPSYGDCTLKARLHAIVEHLNQLAAGGTVLGELAQELRVVTGFDIVLIERHDPAIGRMRVVSHAGLDERQAARIGTAAAQRTVFGLERGESAFFHRALDHRRLEAERLASLGVETLFGVPIRVGSQAMGALSFASLRPIGANETPRASLQAIADHLGAAWSASRLHEMGEDQARVEQVSQQSSILAHEVRNPLNNIALRATSLRMSLGVLPAGLRERLETGLESIEGETRRLESLVQQFLLLGRQRCGRRDPVAFRDLVEEVARFYELTLYEAGIELETELPPCDVTVQVDMAQIAQVLHNLLRNAIEAMPQGGLLSLCSSSENETVALRVVDTGPGVNDPEGAFRFFVTTKPGGTGLGLPVSREIARSHQGELELLSGSKPGAEFQLTLPRV